MDNTSRQSLARQNRHTAAEPPHMKQIAIVDNDERSLDSLHELVERNVAGCTVAWMSSDEYEAIERCSATGHDTDLLLLDMSLEHIQGPSVCRRIRLQNWRMPILAMTSFSLHRYHDKAVLAGAQGLIGKNNTKDIIWAVKAILHHRIFDGFESPAVAYTRIRSEQHRSRNLTIREEQVINLAADDGLLDREIAEELGISEATVRRHMHNILSKLEAKTSRQAIAAWLSPHTDGWLP